MITTVLLFLPCITCLFWLVLNPLVNTNQNGFKTLELLLAMIGIALFAEAGLSCTEGNVLLSLFMTKQFFALMIIPVAFNYIRSLKSSGEIKSYYQVFVAVPASLLVALIILLIITGSESFLDSILNPTANENDNAERLIHFCSFWLFYAILTAETVVFMAFSVINAVRKDYNIHICIVTALIIIYFILEIAVISVFSLWIKGTLSVILACILFMLSYFNIFHMEKKDEKPVFIEDRPSEFVMENKHDLQQSLNDEDSLRIKFEDLIVSEQLFLKQGIRLSDIATMLDTNRTYVSRLVNNTYNMSFSDYINTLRIDYAEQYLLHNRNAKQSDIAAACGFPNASAFNNVFKKITGVTPKIWLATNS